MNEAGMEVRGDDSATRNNKTVRVEDLLEYFDNLASLGSVQVSVSFSSVSLLSGLGGDGMMLDGIMPCRACGLWSTV